MPQYEIKPFETTPDFEACWLASARHLDLRVRDSGASWLRSEPPLFREHLSFALGNQIFFLQIMDADNPKNGWVHKERLGMAVKDANGIGCFMPMRKDGDDWKPVELGWGLVDYRSKLPIAPFELVTDDPIEMTPWEIHDTGIQIVRNFLSENGWIIIGWQNDLNVNPSICAEKDGKCFGIVVRTSDTGSDVAPRPENAAQIAEVMHSRGLGAKFVGLKISSANDDSHFDPELLHLRRKILRRSPMWISPVKIEEL